jgi:thiamine-phosphate diphosphorylase
MTARLPRIWIITMPDHPDGPIAPIERAIGAAPPGLVGIQLRGRGVSDRQLVEWGRNLRSLASATGSAFTVNRRADIAQIVDADGVHLPELGLRPTELRQHWPALGTIGVSRHDRAGLEAAVWQGATYAFLSPIFEVPEKNPPLGIDGFRRAIAGVGIPTYALGGLGPEHVAALTRAGAFGIAIRRAIYAAARPEEVLGRFVRELDKSLATVE